MSECAELGVPVAVVAGDAEQNCLPDDVPYLTLVGLAGSVDAAFRDAARLASEAGRALAARL